MMYSDMILEVGRLDECLPAKGTLKWSLSGVLPEKKFKTNVKKGQFCEIFWPFFANPIYRIPYGTLDFFRIY